MPKLVDMLAVAEVPEDVIGRADPEDAEDLDVGRAFGPKSKVASWVAVPKSWEARGPG